MADQLVKAVIKHACQSVLQLHCTVITHNISALKLYQRHGFQVYGTEPRSLKVDEKFYDEHLMVLQFE
ncbi:MAG: GNAT family N-acetyltransferase [Alphaproteobacteria bacterium]|nr:GNAT family N-acetyltransferase [Alphaproteobacteria bacterium]MBP9777201.1 GNAT family N-acetyltransferase [Alphaproteobacteria bacterium]